MCLQPPQCPKRWQWHDLLCRPLVYYVTRQAVRVTHFAGKQNGETHPEAGDRFAQEASFALKSNDPAGDQLNS